MAKRAALKIDSTVELCPSCGGSEVQLLRFNGETYFQCMTPKHRPGEKEMGGEPTSFCKFWSTKWRPLPTN